MRHESSGKKFTVIFDCDSKKCVHIAYSSRRHLWSPSSLRAGHIFSSNDPVMIYTPYMSILYYRIYITGRVYNLPHVGRNFGILYSFQSNLQAS
jgi:hypothetical protein